MKVPVCAEDGRLLTCWANFFKHVRADRAQPLNGDTLNHALKEHNAIYYVLRTQDYGYEEFIEFETEEDHTFFLLRWT